MRRNHLLNKDQEGGFKKVRLDLFDASLFSSLLYKFHSSDGQKERRAFGEWGCRGCTIAWCSI